MAGESGRYPRELLDAAESLTKLVAAGEGFDETMQRVAKLAVEAIDGAEECCISLGIRDDKDLKPLSATDEIGYKIDDLQREMGEGPCLSSIEDRATFRIPVMSEDSTWPKFSRRAADETGIKSMVSYVLRLSDTETGAMNLLSRQDHGFSDEDIDTGVLFAALVAIALADALDEREVAQLKEGMKTREVIGQAIGILMAARRVSAEEAFEILKNVSQTSNVKLREIAARLVEKSGEV